MKASARKYIFLYLPSNGTFTDVVLYHFDLHFKIKHFLLCICINIVSDSGFPRKIFLDSYGPCRGVDLALTYMIVRQCEIENFPFIF